MFSIKPTATNLRKYFTTILICFIIGIILFYFVPIFGISPKINLLLQIVLFSLISFYLRILIYRRSALLISRPVILIGENIYLENLYKIIKSNPQLGYNIIGFYDSENKITKENLSLKNLLIIFDKIPNFPDEEITKIYNNGLEITDTIQAYEKLLQKIPVDIANQEWILDNINIKKDAGYDTTVRVINILASIIILLISSPFLLLAILARYIEDGRPIFIKHKRVGKDGEIFDLYKIRSMVAMYPDGLAETNDNPKWATKHDPRITRVGHIIRKIHIDEIPQIINILKGDITLVGPRPESPNFVPQLESSIPHYKLRHIVKPGFTGWAQIKYRYARTIEDSKEKFEYDLYYIKNRNLFLDIEIILKTIRIVLTH